MKTFFLLVGLLFNILGGLIIVVSHNVQDAMMCVAVGSSITAAGIMMEST